MQKGKDTRERRSKAIQAIHPITSPSSVKIQTMKIVRKIDGKGSTSSSLALVNVLPYMATHSI
jgi:hypothetical protein